MNFRPHVQEELEINLTPLIDVVFLLLIFFMVSTTFQKESDLQIQLPSASQEQAEKLLEPLEIAINAQGQFFINSRELVDQELVTVKKALQEIAAGHKDLPLVIRADARTPHQSVITVMDAASQLGLIKISFVTSRQQE